MLDNLRTQKDMGKVHTSTQKEVAVQVSGDWGGGTENGSYNKTSEEEYF